MPFRGHRQRLDRYDAQDFETFVGVMRQCGLWLYEASPDFVYRGALT